MYVHHWEFVVTQSRPISSWMIGFAQYDRTAPNKIVFAITNDFGPPYGAQRMPIVIGSGVVSHDATFADFRYD